jgi:hypothetical protein
MEIIIYIGKKWREIGDQWTRSYMYHDEKWTLQFLDILYNSIDNNNNNKDEVYGAFLLVYKCMLSGV